MMEKQIRTIEERTQPTKPGDIKDHNRSDFTGWRLKQALDIVLDYLIQLENGNHTDKELSKNQLQGKILQKGDEKKESDAYSLDGFSKRPSKSSLRNLLPPPDLSS